MPEQFASERVQAHVVPCDSDSLVRIRAHTRYGRVRLSVQAGSIFDSTPKVNGLSLGDYVNVEVAIIDDGGQRWLTPAQIGAINCDEFWSADDDNVRIGSHVPWDAVNAIKGALRIFIEPD